jgi:hypothetical protein
MKPGARTRVPSSENSLSDGRPVFKSSSLSIIQFISPGLGPELLKPGLTTAITTTAINGINPKKATIGHLRLLLGSTSVFGVSSLIADIMSHSNDYKN